MRAEAEALAVSGVAMATGMLAGYGEERRDLRCFGAVLELSWGRPGVVLGPSWAPVGLHWAPLGAS